jgi:hypothetical protein
MMQHILITAKGKIMLFYIAELARTYQTLYGGVLVEKHTEEHQQQLLDIPIV